MSKRLSSKFLSSTRLNAAKPLTPWDEAICEAQTQMEEARQRFTRLAESIKTLEALRDSGAPFPVQDRPSKPKAA